MANFGNVSQCVSDGIHYTKEICVAMRGLGDCIENRLDENVARFWSVPSNDHQPALERVLRGM